MGKSHVSISHICMIDVRVQTGAELSTINQHVVGGG